jgi:translation initiation factor 2 alpha subunit (eIF-2alpha)
VQINDVTDDGAYVRLLEYKNREALILAANTTRKRVKNVKKLLRLGT